MSTVEQLLGWARAQIGTVEAGGRDGRSGNVVAYWDQVGLHGDQGQPWCAAFTSAAFRAAGLPVPVMVYCPSAERWYAAQGRLHSRDQGQPGDQAFYNFGALPWPGHTGIVESIDSAAGTVTVIEGNTSPSLAGSQTNGGGVYRRTRPLVVVRSFGRPPYATSPIPSPAPAPAPPAPVVFDLDGVPMVRLLVTVPTDHAGNGWVDKISRPELATVDAAKMVAATVQGSAPARDGRYWPGEAHWQDDGGHPLVSVTGAQPDAQANVFVVAAA